MKRSIHFAKFLRYLDTLESRLLTLSVATIANVPVVGPNANPALTVDAVKNLRILAKSGSEHTRNAAMNALERFGVA